MTRRITLAVATMACLFSGAVIACEAMKPADVMGSAPTNATRMPTQQAKAQAPSTVRRDARQTACASGACTSDPKEAKQPGTAKPAVAIACAGGNCS